jgi:hypothetical protein
MADKKTSQLTPATTLAGTELIPIVQGGANKSATPDLIKTFVGSGGSMPEVTFDELMTLKNSGDGAGSLVPGFYKVTDFATRHFLTNGLGEQVNGTMDVDCPAPSNISITPDAVGDNPVTYYFRLIGIDGPGSTRSLISNEIVVELGEDTTELMIGCDIPEGIVSVVVYRGIETGVYTEISDLQIIEGSNPIDVLSGDGIIPSPEGMTYNDRVSIPIAQITLDSPSEHTGATETIIVTATSPNTIAREVHSVEYPRDKIEWDWDASHFADNINFTTGEEYTLISGFKGVITYRKDTIQNNSAGFDFRNCLNRLWSIAQPEWSADSGTYNEGDFVQVTGESIKIYIALDSAIGTDVPGVEDSIIWRELWDITDTPYWSNNDGTVGDNGMKIDNNTTIPVLNTSDFIDIPTFGNAYETVSNIHLPESVIDNAWWEIGNWIGKISIPTIVFHSKEGNTIIDGSFGDDCMLMVFGNRNYSFSFGNNNSSFSFGNNNSSFSFGNNNYSFSFGNSNSSFSFGNSNYSFSFGNNNSSFSFGNNNETFTGQLQMVTCGDGISFYSIDFSSAYYIIQQYSKTIIKDSAGVVKLWYIDDAGVMQVKAINEGEPM